MIHDLYMIKSRNDRRYLDNLIEARRIAEDIASSIRESVSIYKEDPISEVTTFVEEVFPGTGAEMLRPGG